MHYGIIEMPDEKHRGVKRTAQLHEQVFSDEREAQA